MTTPQAYNIAQQAVLLMKPDERLAYIQQYLANHSEQVGDNEKYVELLQRLVNENNGCLDDPVTPFGCLVHFRSLSEAAFLEKLAPYNLGHSERMPDEERSAAYRAMQAVSIPELSAEDKAILFSTGSSKPPALWQLFAQDLQKPAGELIYEYCGERDHYAVFEDSDWLAETVIEPLLNLRPDVVAAITSVLATAYPEGIFADALESILANQQHRPAEKASA